MKVVAAALAAMFIGALGANASGFNGVAVAATAQTQAAGAAAIDRPAAATALDVTGIVEAATFLANNDDEDDEDTAENSDENADVAKIEKAGALDRLRAVLDKLVTAGTITAAQETAILDAAKEAFAKAAEKPTEKRTRTGIGDIFKVVREYLGVTQQEIAENAKAGKSLAELAVAKGKTRDGLILAIVATVTNPTAETSTFVGKLVDFKGHPNMGNATKDKAAKDRIEKAREKMSERKNNKDR